MCFVILFIFLLCSVFFFNDTATTEIYTLSPTRRSSDLIGLFQKSKLTGPREPITVLLNVIARHETAVRHGSEEHTSELQSHSDLVCRLLLEKKNKSTSYA